MLLMAEMIFHLTFEHGLKNGAKNLLQDVAWSSALLICGC